MNQSIVPCPVLTVVSWPAYRFLRRQVMRSGILTSHFPHFHISTFSHFPHVIPVKGFGIVNKADVFLEVSCFFYHPTDVGNLISGSSAFFKSSLNPCKFSVLQARFQQYVNRELPDVQAGFRKGRGTRDQIANIRWIIKKARGFQKNIYFCFIDYTKAFV